MATMKHKATEISPNHKLFDTVIIRLSGEIAIKGDRTRRIFQSTLQKNIKRALKYNKIKYDDLILKSGRIYLKTSVNNDILKILSRIFGISSISPAIETRFYLKDIINTSLKVAFMFIPEKSRFAVRCRRVGVHPYTSDDVCREVGKRILESLPDRDLKVDLENPDITVGVEVREKEAYVYVDTLEGAGGLPFGTQPKLLGLISGGLDSPIACWLAMKRGSPITFLYIDNAPFTEKVAVERVIRIGKILMNWAPGFHSKLYVVENGENIQDIIEYSPRRLTCILCKRVMYRIASKIAEMIGAQGIVTGEIIGEQASQTLWNLRVINEASQKFPIYRPVIGFDKVDIERLSRKIGTYDISSETSIGCTAAPKKPRIKADLEEIKSIEEKLNIENMINRSISSIRIINI